MYIVINHLKFEDETNKLQWMDTCVASGLNGCIERSPELGLTEATMYPW